MELLSYTACWSQGSLTVRSFSFVIAMAKHVRRNRSTESPSIPDRLYFRIGDVARICGLEAYVLRFWETQFPRLKPNKSKSGQRLYRRSEVELALEIKRLVHREGYTISGARQVLEQCRRGDQARQGEQAGRNSDPEPAMSQPEPANIPKSDAVAAAIGHARAELRQISALLATPVAEAPRRRGRGATPPASSGSLFPL
jgi:DNA-binding transcriptional MerR regulator